MDPFTTAATITRRFTDAAVSGRMDDLHATLAKTVAALEALRDAGVPADVVAEWARQMSDEIAQLEAACERDLDDVGLMPAGALDYDELDAFFK